MRDYRRKPVEAPRIRLRRGADGRLRSAGGDAEIADIWAEQKRIRLAEAIEEDKRRAERRQKRSEFFHNLRAKTRALPKSIRKKGPKNQPKEIVLQIGLPRLKLPRRWAVPKLSKKQLGIGGSALVVVLLAIGGMVFTQHKQQVATKKPSVTTQTLGKKVEKPTYATLLPMGKSVEDLGGWQRVSPPDKDAVFAYIDTINGTQVIVSEQPLPSGFKQDPTGSMAKLAEQFGAKEKVIVDGVTAYLGTSTKGPQSLVMIKANLLILIKSVQNIPTDNWAAYISSLQ